MKKEQDFIIIPERYIFELSETITIEKNKDCISINGEQKQDNKIIVEVNRIFTDADYKKIKESIE